MPGRAGGAISADAANQQYVSVPAIDLSGTRAVTVALWVNRTDSTDRGRVLFQSGADDGRSATAFSLLSDDACHGIQAAVHGDAGYTANCYSQPSFGVWHHLAVVFDKGETAGDQVTFYLDGVLQVPIRSLAASSSTNNFGDDPIYLFSRGGTGMFDSARVDDLRIYNTALTASQIQKIYQGSALVSLAIAPARATVPAGAKQRFTAKGTDADGSEQDLTHWVTWTSTSATVATMDRGGLLTSVATGSTTVQATSSSVRGSAGVIVTSPAEVMDSAAPGGWQQGFDFRNTSTFVTDPPGSTYVLSDTIYPTTVGGVTFGWARENSVGASDRSTQVDPRLAGTNYARSDHPAAFYVDLPAPGSYSVALAMGDAIYRECWSGCQVQFLDGNTVLATVAGGQIAAGFFYDAAGNSWSASDWPTKNQTQQVTLTGTRLTVMVGRPGAGVDRLANSVTPVAYLGVTQAGGPPNFTISASPSSLTVQQGKRGTSTITTIVSGGFNSSIALSASGVPSGTTVSFNPNPIPAPGSGSSTMTITVGGSTPTGTYPITVTGNGGGIQQNATVTLTVAPDPDFTISASPASLSVLRGNKGTSTITTTVSGGFNSAIMLSASGVPSGTTVSFNPNPIPAPGSGNSTMTITVGAATHTGMYTITVTGNGGGTQHSATVTLTVLASVSLTWTGSIDPVVGYNVYSSTTSGGPYTKLNSSLISNTSYLDQTVQSGVTYYYVATAVDPQGQESVYSNQASATVP